MCQVRGSKMATGQLRDPGRGKTFFSSQKHPDGPAQWPTHSPIQCVPGGLSPGLKRLGRKTDRSAYTLRLGYKNQPFNDV